MTFHLTHSRRAAAAAVFLLALGASIHAGRVLTAPTVDGTGITVGNYASAAHVGVQTNNTGAAANNVNELDAMVVADDGTNLYLGLTGNLTGPGRLYIIIDSVAGGVANLSDPNVTGVTVFNELATTAGALAFPAATNDQLAFTADYALCFTPADSRLYYGAYGTLSGADLGNAAPYLNGFELGLNNTNTGGVNGTPNPGFGGTPTAPTTGFEIKIPLSEIGSPLVGADVRIFAFITNSTTPAVTVTNQFLPGLLATTASFGTNTAAFPAGYLPYQYAIGSITSWTNGILDNTVPVASNLGLQAGTITRANGATSTGAADTFESFILSTAATPATTHPLHRIALSTVGYRDIVLSYNERRTNNGPREHTVWYSNDGGASFTAFTPPLTNPDNAGARIRRIDLSAITAIDNDGGVVFLFDPYQSESAISSWRQSNIHVCATPLDLTAPTISSITRDNPTPTNLATVSYTVTFSEPVTGVAAANFSVPTTGGQAGAFVSNVSGSGATRTVSVSTVDNAAGTIGLNLDVLSPVIEDLSGNDLVTTLTGEQYLVDREDPFVTTILRSDANPTNAASVDFLVTFSESVSGPATGNFSAVGGGGQGAASVSGVTGLGNTRTVSVNTVDDATGTVELTLSSATPSITDALGNALTLTFTGSEIYTVDREDPTVTSITRVDANPTNAASVNFLVTFNENVTGGAGSNFGVTAGGGQVGASVTGISGSNSTRTITVDTVDDASGTIRLDLVSTSPSIADSLGNTLTGTFAAGESYTVDRQDPALASITVVSERVIDVTFDEAVSGANLPAAYTASGPGIGTLAANPNSAVFQSGNTFRLTWTAPQEMFGGVSISVTAANTIADALGNTVGVLNNDSDTSIGIAPTVVSVDSISSNQVDITFDETMGGSGVTTGTTYSISGTGQGTLSQHPTSSVLQTGTTYRLTWATGSQSFGGDVTITASTTATDLAGNPCGTPNSATDAGGGIPVELSAFSLE